MSPFENEWRENKRLIIGDFAPFGLVGGKLWAPAWIKDRWRVLELDLDVARKGAANVFALAGDGSNVVSLFQAVMRRSDGKAAS